LLVFVARVSGNRSGCESECLEAEVGAATFGAWQSMVLPAFDMQKSCPFFVMHAKVAQHVQQHKTKQHVETHTIAQFSL
jgi:hypothetical protein